MSSRKDKKPPVSRRLSPSGVPEGELVGRYKVILQLGRGGTGTVYLADDPLLGVRICLKVLHPALAENAEAVARFSREILLARRVSHPGISKLFDLHDDGELRFITMEYVEGPTLREVIDTTAPQNGAPIGLPVPRMVRIGAGIAQALAAAHDVGVVHRDLKPRNIIVRAGDMVCILDFGIAISPTELSSRLTVPGSPLGTRDYIAPEVWARKDPDALSDIYAVGVMLYHGLTGRLPYDSTSDVSLLEAMKTQKVRPPSVYNPAIDHGLDKIVMTALALNPGERFQRAAELEKALMGTLAESDQTEYLQVSRLRDSKPRVVALFPEGDDGAPRPQSAISVGMREQMAALPSLLKQDTADSTSLDRAARAQPKPQPLSEGDETQAFAVVTNPSLKRKRALPLPPAAAAQMVAVAPPAGPSLTPPGPSQSPGPSLTPSGPPAMPPLGAAPRPAIDQSRSWVVSGDAAAAMVAELHAEGEKKKPRDDKKGAGARMRTMLLTDRPMKRSSMLPTWSTMVGVLVAIGLLVAVGTFFGRFFHRAAEDEAASTVVDAGAADEESQGAAASDGLAARAAPPAPPPDDAPATPPAAPPPAAVVVAAPPEVESRPVTADAPAKPSPANIEATFLQADGELHAAMRARGILPGDVRAIDAMREQADSAAAMGRHDLGAEIVAQALQRLDEVRIDRAMLRTKRERLLAGLTPLARAHVRDELARADAALRRRDLDAANAALNEAWARRLDTTTR